jgi:hypothetical protein
VPNSFYSAVAENSKGGVGTSNTSTSSELLKEARKTGGRGGRIKNNENR